jgi:hypothetical protein
VNDSFSDKKVWVPSSGFVAGAIASSSQQAYPWSAVAGFTRGTLTGVTDLAINPTRKQMDLLYKININPITFFPNLLLALKLQPKVTTKLVHYKNKDRCLIEKKVC